MKKRLNAILAMLLVLILLLVGCTSSAAGDVSGQLGESRAVTNSEVSEEPMTASPTPDQLETGAPSPLMESDTPSAEPALTEAPAQLTPAPSEIPEDSSIEIHFIDVGQGDCALILCDGATMLIDGGDSSASSKVYAYLKAHNVDTLDYIVATHPDADHIGGLSGALNYATAKVAYCPVTEHDTKTFANFTKYLNAQGVSITIPTAGDTFPLGSATVQILGPQKDYEDTNDLSIVLRVVYAETSFLFTGDAERTAEADILEAGYDLSSTVLKVGHHGSDSSTSYPFLREVMPQYAVISVGKDNSYGHPTENTLSKLRDAEVKVYRTDLQGTIICTSDGKTVTFTTEKNENISTNPTETAPAIEAGEYIGNVNSKKFHLPTCQTLPAEQNRVFFDSREEAVDAGYSPCGNCKP